MALMVDYWLAGRFGNVWLRLHKALRATLGELPGECALVASGEPLSARRLYQVQDFAARVWWRAGMAVFVLGGPVGIGLVALFPGRVGTDVGVSVLLAAGCFAGASMLQMGLISFRAGQVKLYTQSSASQGADEPVPAGSLGLPSTWDFWVMLVVALGTFGILAYAGLH
jgi:hypothetical protein